MGVEYRNGEGMLVGMKEGRKGSKEN